MFDKDGKLFIFQIFLASFLRHGFRVINNFNTIYDIATSCGFVKMSVDWFR